MHARFLLLLSLFGAVFAEELDVDEEAIADAEAASAAEMSDEEYEEMFKELDEDGNGKLTLTEVMDSLQSELEEEFGDEVPEKLKELLTAADADSNEELSKPELLSFVEKTQEYLESLEMAGGDDEDMEEEEEEDI
jgi:Ca2+-binding EF-hand superfamily protein